MRLLIVEDDLELAAAVRAGLDRRGLPSDYASSLGDADQMLRAMAYSAVVLDLGLSDGNGLDLLHRVRSEQRDLPILILTARGDIEDRLAGLNAGGDDYLVKPFNMDELAARLRALLRRGGLREISLTLGNLRFDESSRELSVDNVSVGLSAREAEIMELLLRRAGRVVTKGFVEDQLFGLDDNLGSNAIEVYVHRLRKKLEKANASAAIVTIRGVGYILRQNP
jgi:two-component system response regulator QseB